MINWLIRIINRRRLKKEFLEEVEKLRVKAEEHGLIITKTYDLQCKKCSQDLLHYVCGSLTPHYALLLKELDVRKKVYNIQRSVM